MSKPMKARLFATLSALLLTGVVAVPGPLADNTEAASDSGAPEVLHRDWMQWLPGSLRMDEISLPTTHDSGTRHCDTNKPFWEYCLTQSMWYDAQLDAGIRAFDVRVYLKLGESGEPADDWLGQAHGSYDIVDSSDPDRPNIDLAVVLRDTCDWLALHPTEAVVMKVSDDGLGDRHEAEDLEETEDVNEAWERWKDALRADIAAFRSCIWEPPGDYYYPLPTLDDIRGKILIRPKGCGEWTCRDIGRAFSTDPSGVEGSGTSVGERAFTNESLGNAMEELTDVLQWGDFVSGFWDLPPEEQTFWRQVLPPIPSEPVFIQTGTNGVHLVTPYGFAFGEDPWVPQGMNERMLEWLLGISEVGGDGGLSVDHLGLLSMDFPGASLIEAIIAHNFDLADDPGATGADFARMLTPIAHQIENEVANSAAARGGKLAAFLRHVYESTQLHVITVKGKNAIVGIDADHNGVFGRTGDVHDYRHIAFMGGRGTAPSAVAARNALQRGVTAGGLFGDPGQRARLVGARLRGEFPDHDVTVMSWDPGQVSDADWNLPNGSVMAGPLLDNIGFAYVAWLYNGPKADIEAPVLTLPGDATLDTDPGSAGAVLHYAAQVSAVDNVDPDPQVTCAPASGSLFLAGPTTVTCTAVDTAGNEASEQFTVFVLDTEAPELKVPPDVTLDKDAGSAGAVYEYAAEVSAVDNVDADPKVTCAPASGSLFPVGPTTVTCTAVDRAGNEASDQFSVIVLDSGPPGC